MRAILFALGAFVAPTAWADRVDDAHRRLLGRSDLQFQLTPVPERPQQASNWLSGLLDAIAPIFNVIFWGALAAAVMALAFFIGREIWQTSYGSDSKVPARGPVQETSYRPEAARARALLEDADLYARQGLYDDAVRILLHRSIDDIEQRSPRAIRRAQTSREIANLAILPQTARTAFAPLVRAVERSWFGGVHLDEQGYLECRESYVRFALPEAWR